MRRLPAEWEKQSFLQFTFPHKDSDWADLLPEVTQCFVEIISKASQFQDILIICDNIKRVHSLFNNHRNIFCIQNPSNDTWARDHGGISIYENENPVILDFEFNGWGNKFNARYDNQITRKLFDMEAFTNCNLKSIPFILEGGAIETDGNGTLLTTSQCLLNRNRNPEFSKKEMEAFLNKELGINSFLWLDYGYLAGDDTDSHIDTLARFCNEKTIIYQGCRNPNDEHYIELLKMKQQLQSFYKSDKKPYTLVELPFPDACTDMKGNRLPASYANFTIINDAVLLPVYGVSQDQEAIKIIKRCFPKRKIIDINCRVLIEQHGSLHCITMQYHKDIVLNKQKIKSYG